MNESSETYAVVVYSDGERFISPVRFCKLRSVVDVPRAILIDNEYESERMQATLALFHQTGIRVDQGDLESIGTFSSDENFNLDVYYVGVNRLPDKSKLKCNQTYTLHNSQERIVTIEDYQYISFSELDNFTYSIKGMKRVLEKVDQHYNKGISWDEIV